MNWLVRLQDCVDYIESHLNSEIDLAILARTACLSKFYFTRMFQYVTDIPLNEYICRRRMTLAAQELMLTDRKIIDLALDYGYASPEAFSRAFKRVQGMSPSEIRSFNRKIKAYPPISFQIQIKGDVAMDYKIVKKASFDVIGVGRQFSLANGENLIKIPEFWTEFNHTGQCEQLNAYSAREEIYGVCMNGDNRKDTFDYVIAVAHNGKTPSQDFKIYHIPAHTWAVFDSIRVSELQKVTKRIYSEWLPATKYEVDDAPEIEKYPYGDITEENYRCEIWIPIKAL